MKDKLIYVLLFSVLFSCTLEEMGPVETPVAQVNDKYLYKKDIDKLFRRQKVSEQDSLNIVKTYIDNWIEEQLMLSKAEMNLTLEEKDVQEKLNKYRNSLLIYKYQENYLKEHLDTLVSLEEIKQYYDENPQNFRLDQNLVKAIFIKITREIPLQDYYQTRRWILSTKEEDEQQLYNYCSEEAEKFDDFDNDWVDFNMIQLQLPRKVANPERTLKWKKFIDDKDTTYYYFVRIDEFVPQSEVAPLEYIDEKIKGIIMNKRKITLIKELENSVYNEAMNRDMIKIY